MSKIENIKESVLSISRSNPDLFNRLIGYDKQKIEDHFQFCTTEKKELNLLYRRRGRSLYYHSQQGAVAQTTDWIKTNLARAQIIYLFGVGLGYAFLSLRKWLEANQDHQLIIIEPQLPVLIFLFQTEIGKKMALHPRIHFHQFNNRSELRGLLQPITIEFGTLKPCVLTLPCYQKFTHISNLLRHQIPIFHENLSTLFIESEHSKYKSFKNMVSISLHLQGRYNASEFKNIFKKVPCIIVGAGPSLKKNLSVLKTLQDKALIFAGSSAIPALSQQGLEPHLGNFFDPYPRVFQRLTNSLNFELPTFHSPRTFSKVARWIHGPQLYAKGGDSIPLTPWIEEAANFSGEQIKEHISVTVSNTLLATLMGCDPIIYVGLDLAYTDNQSYAAKVCEEPSIRENKEDSDTFEFNAELSSFDIFNKPIRTRHGWVLEADVLSILTKQYNCHTFINATEGGLGISGVENMSLLNVKEKFLQTNYPLQEKVHSEISPYLINHSKYHLAVKKRLKEFCKSLNRCLKIYQKVIQELKKLLLQNKKQQLTKLNSPIVDDSLKLLGHEIGYQYLMKRYHQIVDIKHLKFRHFKRFLSKEAPVTLEYELKLLDMLNRFKEYYSTCREFRLIIKNELNHEKEDPWQ